MKNSLFDILILLAIGLCLILLIPLCLFIKFSNRGEFDRNTNPNP